MRTLLLLLLASSPALAGDLYKDTQRHFQFRIPDGWFVVPQAELDALVAVGRERIKTDQTLDYICCLRRKGSSPGEFPYIVLQDIPTATRYRTWEDVEAMMNNNLQQPVAQIQHDNRDLLKSLDLNKTYCDRATHRVFMTLTMEAQGIGKFREIAFGHVGAERMIFLHCWHEDEEFESLLPTFEKASESFQYDDGFAFQPETAAKPANYISGLMYGAGLAVLLGGMLIYIRRRS